MPRPLFDSPYIYGLHDPGGESIMAAANRRGWIVFTEEIGSDPKNTTGKDFRPWSSQDFGVICRINNGYGTAGTIPTSDRYADFARRVANYVTASPGCKIWIIGNEMNFSQEWPAQQTGRARAGLQPSARPARGPDADPYDRGDSQRFSALSDAGEQAGEPTTEPAPFAPVTAAPPSSRAGLVGREMITPALYVQCFRLCRNAIKALPGHGDDQVLIGAVAPWNDNAQYPGNEIGDWVRYMADILAGLGISGLDGIALHTYTHGSDPALIYDTSTMNSPFQNRYYNFLAYRNFMQAIPSGMRALPVYITESNQDVAWLDQNNGWVQGAYAEINWWNQQPGNQQIRALALYRWLPYDKWHIQGKQGVIDGFLAALSAGYQWQPAPQQPFPFRAGDLVRTLTYLNLRAAAGGAVIATLDPDERLVVLDGKPVQQGGLVWWRLRRQINGQDGWAAQATGDGQPLLEKASASLPPDPIKPGDTVRTLTVVRIRRTPGISNKPPGDVVTELPAGAVAPVQAGPQQADGMTWWRLTATLPDNSRVNGWAAEKLPNGTVLLEKVRTPQPDPPPGVTFSPGDRYRTTTVVRLRKTPGATNKPADDVIADVPAETRGVIDGGPQRVDDLTWWRVITSVGGGPLQGWMAEALPGFGPLLVPAEAETPGASTGVFRVVTTPANVRRTPGYVNKPADDIIGYFRPRTVVNIQGASGKVDGLPWRMAGGITPTGAAAVGHVAETDAAGQPLLVQPPVLPATQIPNPGNDVYLSALTDQPQAISQLWGENPAFYGQYQYDGVPLLGHNGIDFMTPMGTLIFAVDDGVVARAEFEPNGFGNFVLLSHPWGESIYAHLASSGVVPGQSVGRGQFLGFSGSTGASTGPHLHFAIRTNPYDRKDGWGGYADPLPYLPPDSFQLPQEVLTPSSVRTSALAQPIARRTQPPGMGSGSGFRRP